MDQKIKESVLTHFSEFVKPEQYVLSKSTIRIESTKNIVIAINQNDIDIANPSIIANYDNVIARSNKILEYIVKSPLEKTILDLFGRSVKLLNQEPINIQVDISYNNSAISSTINISNIKFNNKNSVIVFSIDVIGNLLIVNTCVSVKLRETWSSYTIPAGQFIDTHSINLESIMNHYIK